MDHYIAKRRIPVTIWSPQLPGLRGWVFLDLDGAGNRHQTVLDKLNESPPFLPLAVGDDGRIQLVNKRRISRVTMGSRVIQSDIFSRGFEPWREEEAEVVLDEGTMFRGRIWMPLQRETQRISDFINQRGGQYFALVTTVGVHLLHAGAVVSIRLAESAGAPLAAGEESEDEEPPAGNGGGDSPPETVERGEGLAAADGDANAPGWGSEAVDESATRA